MDSQSQLLDLPTRGDGDCTREMRRCRPNIRFPEETASFIHTSARTEGVAHTACLSSLFLVYLGTGVTVTVEFFKGDVSQGLSFVLGSWHLLGGV
jgi:hypothetical protein